MLELEFRFRSDLKLYVRLLEFKPTMLSPIMYVKIFALNKNSYNVCIKTVATQSKLQCK